jgi:hypothetical protein
MFSLMSATQITFTTNLCGGTHHGDRQRDNYPGRITGACSHPQQQYRAQRRHNDPSDPDQLRRVPFRYGAVNLNTQRFHHYLQRCRFARFGLRLSELAC